MIWRWVTATENRTLGTLAAVLVVVAVLVLVAVRCTRSPSEDAWEALRDEVDARVDAELASGRLELERLQCDVDALSWELEEIRADLAEGVRVREEAHDALELATDIDAVDRVLRGGGMAHGRRGR